MARKPKVSLTDVDSVDLTALSIEQLYQLRDLAYAQISKNLKDRLKQVRKHLKINATYLVRWPIDGSEYLAEVLEILPNGLIVVKWAFEEEGYPRESLVSVDCIGEIAPDK